MSGLFSYGFVFKTQFIFHCKFKKFYYANYMFILEQDVGYCVVVIVLSDY